MNFRKSQARSVLQLSGIAFGAFLVAYGVTRVVRHNARPRLYAPKSAFSGTQLGRPIDRLGRRLLSMLPMGLAPKRTSILKRSITINRPPEVVYGFWRNFENLPRFMEHLESVSMNDEAQSHWVARSPAGKKVEWDTHIVDDRPNEVIEWRSIDSRHARTGSRAIKAGVVSFMPAFAGRGTEVGVLLEYEQPGGKLGALVNGMLGENPEHHLREDLRRFKQLLEAGEIPTGKNQISHRAKESYA
jgi:uncharacterized membrane protein